MSLTELLYVPGNQHYLTVLVTITSLSRIPHLLQMHSRRAASKGLHHPPHLSLNLLANILPIPPSFIQWLYRQPGYSITKNCSKSISTISHSHIYPSTTNVRVCRADPSHTYVRWKRLSTSRVFTFIGKTMKARNWKRLCCPTVSGSQSLSPGDGDFS